MTWSGPVSGHLNCYEGMYFAGILAASISTTNKIGYIGGAASPELNSDYNAYAAGAKTVTPGISVAGAFVGSFTDPNGGQQVADSMYGSGVDVIQTDASATDLGVLKSAEAHKLFMSYDSDPTAYKQAPSLILGSAILQFGTSLALQLKSAMQPTWSLAGHSVEQGLKEKVTGYTPSPVFATSAPAAVATDWDKTSWKVALLDLKAMVLTLETLSPKTLMALPMVLRPLILAYNELETPISLPPVSLLCVLV